MVALPSIAVVSHSNSTSNHNGSPAGAAVAAVVSHSNSTSNHNDYEGNTQALVVVSHSNSTSNHNGNASPVSFTLLFLIPILHQTTTDNTPPPSAKGCFSFQFYIKPQPLPAVLACPQSCFSFQFYIKPQRSAEPPGLS